MADLTITAASVIAGADSVQRTKLANATITAGQALYLDTATDRVGLADSDSATAAIRGFYGIALNGGAVGQPIVVHTRGSITIGATMTATLAYYLSDAPGGICPYADLATGDYVLLIGQATSASVLNVQPQDTGVAL